MKFAVVLLVCFAASQVSAQIYGKVPRGAATGDTAGPPNNGAARPPTPITGDTARPPTPSTGESARPPNSGVARPPTPTTGDSARPPTAADLARPPTPSTGESARPPNSGVARPPTPTTGDSARPQPSSGCQTKPQTPIPTSEKEMIADMINFLQTNPDLQAFMEYYMSPVAVPTGRK